MVDTAEERPLYETSSRLTLRASRIIVIQEEWPLSVRSFSSRSSVVGLAPNHGS